MSFLKKAREAVEQVGGVATPAGEPASAAPGWVQPAASGTPPAPGAVAPGSGWGQPGAGMSVKSAGVQAREALGIAKKGLAGVVDRLDPGMMADLIIRTTALQEKTNVALQLKRSPYRIAEIVISASIPPAVSFTIARVEDPDITDVASTDLVRQTTPASELTDLDDATADLATGATTDGIP
jgi:hypothetical protein